MEEQNENYEARKRQINRLCDITNYLRKTSWKSNIMKECAGLFYDRDFMNKLDQNPYLLCCKNYVIDFEKKSVSYIENLINKDGGIGGVPINIDFVDINHVLAGHDEKAWLQYKKILDMGDYTFARAPGAFGGISKYKRKYLQRMVLRIFTGTNRARQDNYKIKMPIKLEITFL